MAAIDPGDVEDIEKIEVSRQRRRCLCMYRTYKLMHCIQILY
jgi:hypothetical protein